MMQKRHSIFGHSGTRMRILSFLSFLAAWVFAPALAGACSPPPPTVTISASDAPNCIQLEDGSYSPITVTNNCDKAYTFGNLAYAQLVGSNDTPTLDQGQYTLEPGEGAILNATDGESLTWADGDGAEGAIALEYTTNSGSCGDSDGCDAMAAQGGSTGGAVAMGVLVLLGLARRRRRV